jgi:hypothetical protein
MNGNVWRNFQVHTIHRNLRPKRIISSQKWTIPHVKQSKFNIGVLSADRLGCLLLSRGTSFFGQFDRPEYINALSF